MEFQLRPYQVEAVQAGVEFMLDSRRKNGIMILPTGSGKSLCISGIASQLNGPTLVLQPSREILQQNLAKFHSYGIKPGVYSASMGRKSISDVTLAMIGSIAGNKNRTSKSLLFDDFEYILIDECSLVNPKIGLYKKFLAELGDRKVLGFDATPFRLYSNSYGSEMRFLTRTRPKVFDEVVYYAQIQDLFERGYLARPSYFSMHKELQYDEAQLELNSQGSDFSDDSVQQHLFKIGFKEKLVDVVRRLIAQDRRGILVFTRFVPEAEYLASQIRDVAVVSTKTSNSERDRILRAFKNGDIKAVANVGIIAIGFDYPRLDTVVLGRTTMSLRVYYQQVGRVLRPDPDKQSVWVVDMVDNVKRFGKIEHLRLYCEGSRKWGFWGRPGGGKEIALTNTYLAGSATMPRCKACQSTDIFFARHEVTGNSAVLSRPKEGMKANIILKENPQNPKGAKVYAIVPAESEGAEFVNHRSLCRGRK